MDMNVKRIEVKYMDVKTYLKKKPLLFDGAMGTYFNIKNNVSYEKCEMANIYEKDLILKIHKEYIEAGCNAIKTNTFSANTVSLRTDFETVKKVIVEGYKIATEAVKETEVFIFADIGPMPFVNENNFEEYKKIIDTFLELGAENFIFETFSTVRYIDKLAEYIKSKNENAFIIASFAINPEGYTRRGHVGSKIVQNISSNSDIDAVGFNCLSGPAHLYQYIKSMNIYDKIISIMPNAGYPTWIGRKTVYSDSSKYFAEIMADIVKCGVKIVGGCCGTTPEYIKQIREALNSLSARNDTIIKNITNKDISKKVSKNEFLEKLNSGEKKVIAVELDPPINPEITTFMKCAERLKNKEVDAVTIADCPIARARIDSSILACKLKRELNITPIPHMTCRDRNINATKALLLGLNIEDVNNVLLVTGDPIPAEFRDDVKAVFSYNSAVLSNYIKNLNDTVFDKKINVLGALNVNAVNFDNELKKAKKKIECNMTAFLTQPVLTEQALQNLKRAKKELNAKILGGIIPIVSYRNACFMSNEISGINVSEEIIKLYENVTKEEATELAVKVSTKVAEKIKDYVDGYYLITPFNRIDIIERIIDNIKLLDGK